MDYIVFALDCLGAFIILVLIYANVFELKQKTRKKSLFTYILIITEISMIVDAITWVDLGWDHAPALLWLFNLLSYIIPILVIGVFPIYLHAHISEKKEISVTSFKISSYASWIAIIAFTILGINGQLFYIIDNVYYPGPLESLYYFFCLVIMIVYACLILEYSKTLGKHDLVGALSFCIIPVIGSLVAMTDLGVSLNTPFIAIDMLIMFILLQSDRETELLHDSNVDELTGLLNRRAYEDDRLKYPSIPEEPDFVYASIDINGLKQVNDTLGHAAGDELIHGAAQCLKRTLGNYGHVYRTGGDEFVSIFFADEDKLKFLMEDVDLVVSQWQGTYVDSLSISVGYAPKKEFPNATIDELAKISDKRMYKAKEIYYSSRGIDRRRQVSAQTALIKLYTKILKVNLTEDSFSIVNMDISEQTLEKGFSNTISEWLSNFGSSGQVHPSDLEEYLKRTDLNYLRQYFKDGNSSLTIHYRRKIEDTFKHVTMEVIPADDYRDDYQTVFLYVKNID